ncbi:MAG TPA: hypothetical protein VNM22_10655 [Candidatus Limnocylindrales bacterium]|nr:hypothetical protein [Candidatus Limnocylindrales bacterium]
MLLAKRGLRNLDKGIEKIQTKSEIMQLHYQARKVYIKSIFVAILLTLLGLLIP